VFLSLWVLRIVLCVFFSMGSGNCFVFFSIWVLKIVLCVFLETKAHKTILRPHSDKNTQNNTQNPYSKKHTKQSSEPI
jgi:heme exporter protein D